MNSEPHTHALNIYTAEHTWIIDYGDQHAQIWKPKFRDPAKVLDKAVRKMIEAHDRGSAGRTVEPAKAAAEIAKNTVSALIPTQWASDQLSNEGIITTPGFFKGSET